QVSCCRQSKVERGNACSIPRGGKGMKLDTLSSPVSRVMFMGACALLAIAVLQTISNYFGYTFLRKYYAPGRVLEFSTMCLMFVITILLRQIREALKK